MSKAPSLVHTLASLLAKEGYQQLPIHRNASALFFKRVERVFLTLGIEVSRRQRDSFTASFYIAPTFTWSYAPPDGFPSKAYRRIGECLTAEQRKEVDPNATTKQVDVWWNGFTQERAEHFVHLLGPAEIRFLSTKGLAKSVETAPAMQELLLQLGAVQSEFCKKVLPKSPLLDELPKEKVIPINWYAAAAKVAKEQFQEYNHKSGIKMLAEESWLLMGFGRT